MLRIAGIAVGFALFIAHAQAGEPAQQKDSVPQTWLACEYDSDCALVSAACKSFAVNNSYVQSYYDLKGRYKGVCPPAKLKEQALCSHTRVPPDQKLSGEEKQFIRELPFAKVTVERRGIDKNGKEYFERQSDPACFVYRTAPK